MLNISDGFDLRYMDKEQILRPLASLGRPFLMAEYQNLIEDVTGDNVSADYLRAMFYFHKIAFEGVGGWILSKDIIAECLMYLTNSENRFGKPPQQ